MSGSPVGLGVHAYRVGRVGLTGKKSRWTMGVIDTDKQRSGVGERGCRSPGCEKRGVGGWKKYCRQDVKILEKM